MKKLSGSSLSKLSSAALTSDINVTPLVDVCLVLLIIFMVVTPMLQKGVPVNLPVTEDPEKTPDTEKQLLISLKSCARSRCSRRWKRSIRVPLTARSPSKATSWSSTATCSTS
jgi:biopolymer transport protein ExbD